MLELNLEKVKGRGTEGQQIDSQFYRLDRRTRIGGRD